MNIEIPIPDFGSNSESVSSANSSSRYVMHICAIQAWKFPSCLIPSDEESESDEEDPNSLPPAITGLPPPELGDFDGEDNGESYSLPNKILRNLMLRHRRKGTEKLFQHFLNFIHNVLEPLGTFSRLRQLRYPRLGLDTSTIAKTVHTLKKVDEWACTKIPIEEATLSSGRKLFYHHPLNLIQLALRDEWFTANFRLSPPPANDHSHPSNFAAWKQYAVCVLFDYDSDFDCYCDSRFWSSF